MSKSTFVYVTFIRTTPTKLWEALTDPQFIRQYWFGMTIESGWTKGSSWKMARPDGTLTDSGKVLEIDPPRRMVIQWRHEGKEELKAEGDSFCTFELEPVPDADPTVVKLSITHAIDCPESKLIHAVSGGWPRILSNLKSLLETGERIL